MAEVMPGCRGTAVFSEEQARYVAEAMTLDPLEEVDGTWTAVACADHWHVVEAVDP